MARNYLLLGFAMLVLWACNTGEDEVKPTESARDWFEIKDAPGEFNHLCYEIYKNYGLSIFVNDTLGQESRGTDAFGYPILHVELFDPGYYVFGTSNVGFVLCRDTSRMLKAARLIKERVAPYLPPEGEYRPRALLLVDTVYEYFTYSYRLIGYPEWAFCDGLKGIMAGKLSDIDKMPRDEQNYWAGLILAGKGVDWILQHCQEETEAFYNITDEGSRNTYYGQQYNSWNDEYSMPPQEMGFFRWHYPLEEGWPFVYSLPQTFDLRTYMAAVYAFRGEEERFEMLNQEYDKIIRKFRLMQVMVEKYEQANGIK